MILPLVIVAGFNPACYKDDITRQSDQIIILTPIHIKSDYQPYKNTMEYNYIRTEEYIQSFIDKYQDILDQEK
ncbi:hypothetical protein EB001_15135 [bacterium]|nr:hypothetical protein [bacterium]